MALYPDYIQPDPPQVGDVRILVIDGRLLLQVKIGQEYGTEKWIEPRGIELSQRFDITSTSPAVSANIMPVSVHVLTKDGTPT